MEKAESMVQEKDGRFTDLSEDYGGIHIRIPLMREVMDIKETTNKWMSRRKRYVIVYFFYYSFVSFQHNRTVTIQKFAR